MKLRILIERNEPESNPTIDAIAETKAKLRNLKHQAAEQARHNSPLRRNLRARLHHLARSI